MWTECHLSLHPLFLKRWCSMIIFSSLVVFFFYRYNHRITLLLSFTRPSCCISERHNETHRSKRCPPRYVGIVQPVPTRGPGGARWKQAGGERGGDFSSGSKVPVLSWDVHPRTWETSAEVIPSFKEKHIFLCACTRHLCNGALGKDETQHRVSPQLKSFQPGCRSSKPCAAGCTPRSLNPASVWERAATKAAFGKKNGKYRFVAGSSHRVLTTSDRAQPRFK